MKLRANIAVGAVCLIGLIPFSDAKAQFVGQEVAAERLLAAYKANTAQISSAWQQQAAMATKARQAATSAIVQQHDALDIARAKDNTDYQSGQGYKACLVTQGVSTINSAQAGRNTYMQTISTRDNGWFSSGGEQRHTLSSVVGLRRTVYCSQSEQTAFGGWCDAGLGKTRGGGFPAGNSDAGVWLLRRGYGAEESMTGMDYVDTLAPLPSVAAPNSGRADLEQKRQQAIYNGAFVGAARTGLTRTILDGMDDTENNQATEDMVP
ncbi:hypothetical protein AA14337_0770 [Acetobacter malorum DSM 14337]|uniref:Uncharacterized protein n=1 Tax=Acetobacter malorum DSM 14337 TaxID=1307910 RepID=A0ABQ0PPA6_9PROT|nr:hypothetical protein [Acetobacter malorum]KXV08721.1 hypothetical protein AD930_03680 [Acetobacter malorum]GBQ77276.1 hypothetical protein AA14337_0770 [Acetobacter malorum DSM 14337]